MSARPSARQRLAFYTGFCHLVNTLNLTTQGEVEIVDYYSQNTVIQTLLCAVFVNISAFCFNDSNCTVCVCVCVV